ncbi:hypothetical protein CRBSH125_05320 [Afipia carboxidovorans]|nr:hypothetical protein CRBSH125_05320 [Afipia carboxidovorans]
MAEERLSWAFPWAWDRVAAYMAAPIPARKQVGLLGCEAQAERGGGKYIFEVSGRF